MLIQDQLTLSKDNVTIHIFNNTHIDSLTDLAQEKKIWEFAPRPFYQPEVFKENWLSNAIKEIKTQERICFVIYANKKLVGSSSYYDIDVANKTMNIGYTWFHPIVWGTKINPLSKLLMLEYAFETLKFNRIGFSVDSTNERSCFALKKLGVKPEGILRNHLILPNARIRHSCIFSVINEEWLETKQIIHNVISLTKANLDEAKID